MIDQIAFDSHMYHPSYRFQNEAEFGTSTWDLLFDLVKLLV